MYAAQLTAFGQPEQVVSCIEQPAAIDPGPDELTIALQACPINPAELLLIQGRYASKPKLPSPLGIEGVGEVIAIGPQVTDFKVGNKVLSLTRTNWVQQSTLKTDQVLLLPDGIDLKQAAMMKVNPATALKMLDDFMSLKAGDWVIQNAANSGVGLSLIQLAKARGVHTVNVVRRESLRQALLDIGGDVVIVDGPDLSQRVKASVGTGTLLLAIDAVAGHATQRLAECLDDGGTVVNYGLLSGEHCQLGAAQAIFHGISLTGFWLAKTLTAMDYAQMRSLYADLAEQIVKGNLNVPVEAVYPLTEIKQALAHASREGRDGKILLAPHGIEALSN